MVSRVCLDMLRSRAARREDLADLPEAPAPEATDPEREALMADAIGPALLLVLDTLTPAERLAFVLHDMFAVPFPEIADIVGCSPAAARQLASRARRRVQGTSAAFGSGPHLGSSETGPAGRTGAQPPSTPTVPPASGAALRADASAAPATSGPPTRDDASMARDVARRRTVVDAFLAASRSGDFTALLALLDPDVVLRADAAGVRTGAASLVRGANAVAETFSGRARGARTALINGAPGLVWSVNGKPRVVFTFTIADQTALDGAVTAINLLADPDTLAALDLDPTP